ncbi:hypothetical protein MOC16_gp121 [Klebsiella phage vB_KpM_FBKp24]|uniref:Uncharacterized protein n=1 Tax=Klebsiella phage vB_KpM_FBKp24 TaxID=2801834 RepID=A0A7U0J6C7_9CAUD|nr:hypothetical protein MOC16_gp121 [Klebsiella phage vB_KpM_FBKp24]QQV92215.1 hypothetical protein vBKpMFBKp24_292 [Klebsiella phage vB_KpM_FBKp24]
MAKNKRGPSGPQFYYIERKFFRVIEHPEARGSWIVVNINGTPISSNELPLCYPGNNGKMVDALGCHELFAYHFKEGAEKEANRLNERVIAGFEIGFGNTRWNQAKAVFNQNPVLQVVAGMLSAGFLFSVGFLIHQGITVWWK